MTPHGAISPTTNSMEAAALRLEDHIRLLAPRVVVAYSGGVDSTVVLKAATRALGSRALGLLADTESNTEEDLRIAGEIADQHGFTVEVVSYSELAIENYAENPANRCFFCKNELYTRLTAFAASRDIAVVCDGSNADDMGDYRPGLKAVEAHRVRSPLKDLGLGKADVRALAKHYGLPNHERPASPCLSSRIPYGQKITQEKLQQVAEGEAYLRKLGLREFRCRHHGEVARLEIPPDDMQTVLANREAITDEFRRIGFHWVAVDLGGFKSGGLNRVLTTENQTYQSPPESHSEETE